MLLSKSVSRAAIAGIVMVASAGFAASASAAPVGNLQIKADNRSGQLVEVHHRGNKRGGPNLDRGFHAGYYEMGPREIRRSLRHRGFHKIRILDRRGYRYVVKARGWRGLPVRLVVDSRSGAIVRSRPIGPRVHWQHSW